MIVEKMQQAAQDATDGNVLKIQNRAKRDVQKAEEEPRTLETIFVLLFVHRLFPPPMCP